MRFQKTLICMFLTFFVCAVLVICMEGSLRKHLCSVRNDNDIAAFFRYYGYNIILPPQSAEYITVSDDFDNIRTGCNNLRNTLKLCKGKTVLKKTYLIDTSLWNGSNSITGTVFIYNNRIIGADVTDTSEGGFTHPLSAY